jgi:hypothetical protein
MRGQAPKLEGQRPIWALRGSQQRGTAVSPQGSVGWERSADRRAKAPPDPHPTQFRESPMPGQNHLSNSTAPNSEKVETAQAGP